MSAATVKNFREVLAAAKEAMIQTLRGQHKIDFLRYVGYVE